jgi:hypothetical protein
MTSDRVTDEMVDAAAEVLRDCYHPWRADNVRAALEAALPLSKPEAEPVAWVGYWPGAGSIDSVTRTTHFQRQAASWRDNGAHITPVYAALPLVGEDALREFSEITPKELVRLANAATTIVTTNVAGSKVLMWAEDNGLLIARLANFVAEALARAAPKPKPAETK